MIAIIDSLEQKANLHSLRASLERDVLQGLARRPKSLPCRWLYDDIGSELFEAITLLPEYYPTRTETAILRDNASSIADFAGEQVVLLEYGAGAGIKTEMLLESLRNVRLYVPIDVAGDFLHRTTIRLRQRFPDLPAAPVIADFTTEFDLPESLTEDRRVAFFPGSTIGNLSVRESAAFLRRLRLHVGKAGRAIIGVDLRKDTDTLLAAYDDATGITARFNLNLLARLNRELGSDFSLALFEHTVCWNETESAVEMHLRSLTTQTARVGENRFLFEAGETIHTESSRKYTIAGFEAHAWNNGWRVDHVWTDQRSQFAVFGLSHP
ncbi:MAG TPA: L-histidine N(alpha)-methyltransferase [Steroidobacteraceae bacterium]|jgi:dimethylhistidine N-methyltransferase